jgi:hypothetical protein
MKRIVFLIPLILSIVYGYPAENIFSVSATSSAHGFPAAAMFDNNIGTGWKPMYSDDQLLEGVTVRFSEPADIQNILIVCADKSKSIQPSFYIYADGKFVGGIAANKKLNDIGLKSVTELEFYAVNAPAEFIIGEIRINSSGDSNQSVAFPSAVKGKIHIKGISANSGVPELICDGDILSSWTYSYSSQGAAPVISFEFVSNIQFSSLYIANGVQVSEALFKSGGKVKSFELRADGILLGVYTLKEIMGIQRINIDKPALGKNIEMKVVSVYGNDMMKNAALSEVAFGCQGSIVSLEVNPVTTPGMAKVKSADKAIAAGFVSKCMKFQYISLSNITETYFVKFRADGTFTVLSEIYGYHFTKNNFIKGVWNTVKSSPSVWEIALDGIIYTFSEKFKSSGFSENISVEYATGYIAEPLKISSPSPKKMIASPPLKVLVTNTVYITNIVAYAKTNVIIHNNQHIHPLKATNIQITKMTGTNLTAVPVVCETDGNAAVPWCYMVRDFSATNSIAQAAITPGGLIDLFIKNNTGKFWKLESGLIWGIYPAVISELDYIEANRLGEALDLDFLAPKGK